jgi:hypothetical protein
MKKKISFLLFCSFLLLAGSSFTSCSRGYGCPSYGTKADINRKGEMSAKGGKTELFSKKMRSKM